MTTSNLFKMASSTQALFREMFFVTDDAISSLSLPELNELQMLCNGVAEKAQKEIDALKKIIPECVASPGTSQTPQYQAGIGADNGRRRYR